MIVVAGHFRVPVENLPALRPLMLAVIAETRAEAGCIEYAYAEDVAEPGMVRVFERWTDRESLMQHLGAPHMARWGEERAGLGLFDRVIRVWETDEGRLV
jgi:quinol monooxygenase YgiN